MLLLTTGVFAQPVTNAYEIQSIAFKTNNKVYLRWVLGNARQWHAANELGFIIERAEGNATGFIKLNTQPIKPVAEAAARKLPESSGAYSTLGLLYRKPDYSQPGAEDEENNAYTMYILQSSYAQENAILSASMFIDSTIQPGKKYTYRVTVANVEAAKQKIKPFAVQDDNKLPAMPVLQAAFGNRVAKLTWDIKSVIDDYFAVSVEQSIDSIHFNKITERPLLTKIQEANSTDADPSKKIMQYSDKGLENDQLYYYRIIGINIFGVESKPSEVVSGACTSDLTAVPKILSVDTLQNKFILEWSMPDSALKLIKKYEILVSKNNLDSSFKKIQEFPAREDLRAVFDFKPDASNYFIVKAIGVKQDQILQSAPYLYQLKDSIPPDVPKGLVGSIDKTGIVTLKWKLNSEPDFFGYRVFRTFSNSNNYTVLNGTPFPEIMFKDTLSLNQLNSNVYYRISALDNRFNESLQSEFVHLTRPDTIPPAPTGIKSVSLADSKTIQINWVKSFSADVKSYLLFRKEGTDSSSQWVQVAELGSTDTSYTDKNIKASTDYAYKIQAMDFGNLKSSFSQPFNAKVPKPDIKNKAINNLNAYVSHDKQYIELNWSVSKVENVSEYLIYRTINNNEESVSLIATLPADKKIFDDNDVKLNTVYTYYIKAIYKAGGYSNLEKLEVVY